MAEQPSFPWFDPTTPATGSLSRGLHFAAEFAAGRMAAEQALAGLRAEVEAHLANLAVRDAEVSRSTEGIVAAEPAATSARAARLVEPRTGTQRAAILRFVVEGNGSTDFEIARDLRMIPNSVRPRRGELVQAGYVADSGQTRRHRGSDWVIWIATDEARAWYGRTFGAGAA